MINKRAKRWRRLAVRHTRRLRLEPLEDRRLLALVTVTNGLDAVNGDTSSIVNLIATNGGDGISLREAIQAANADNVADTINFAPALSGQTILLGGTELLLTEPLTIDATALADNVVINAQQGSRIFNITATTGDFTLGGLTLTGGRAAGGGGALRSLTSGDLTFDQSNISGNGTTGNFAGGGGILAAGTVTLTQSTISDNSTVGSYSRGGGISADGSVTLTRSTVSGNSTAGSSAHGGGISSYGSVTLTQSAVSGNSTAASFAQGGGIRAYGSVSLIQSTISGNSTAGIFAVGGGIRALRSVSLNQSTISGNSTAGSSAPGGGIWAGDEVTFTRSTVTDNHAVHATSMGGGVFQFDWPANFPFSINSSIVAGNTAGGGGTDLMPDPQSTLAANYSLIGVIPPGIVGIGIITGLPPRLGPLANNGGPTETHALLPGSRAIDAGDASIVFNPAEFDQRGAPFVRVFDSDGAGGARIDIGAYERQAVAGVSLVVDTLVDESDGNYSATDLSLREAIGLANGSIGANTITFAAALTGGGPATILLTGGELAITSDLTITGPGASLLTVDQNTAGSRVFSVDDGNSTNDQAIFLSGLTLTGGHVSGISNRGGAIHSRENLTLTACTISGNEATDSIGGGISQFGGTLAIRASTISDNRARIGGGLALLTGNATIESSTISGNEASGLVALGSSHYGGGIMLGVSTLTVANSTISGNKANDQGGGISVLNFSNLIVRHSTITGNQSSVNGGADFGGGIAIDSYSGATLEHTIVAGNLRGATRDDIGVDFSADTVLASYSLIGDKTGTSLAEAPVGSPDANGNRIGGPAHGAIDPLLGPLANNGGPTWTHALLAGSPALAAGDAAAMSGAGNVPLYDQRGAPFIRVDDGRIDIGAFEILSVGTALPGDYNQNGVVDAADYDIWRSTFGLQVMSGAGADGNRNGIVDAADYVVWRRNLGAKLPVGVGDIFHVIQNSTGNGLPVLANDSDPVPGQTLSIVAVGATDAGGMATVDANGQTIRYTPAPGFVGTERFTYTASDGHGGNVQTMVTVQVIQQAPLLTAHLHANLSIFINGDQRPNPPANIGVTAQAQFISPIHTEVADGRLHIEPSQTGPPTQNVTVNDFFTTWRTNAGAAGNNPNAIFTANQVLDHVRAADEVVRMYVNGLPVAALGSYIIRNEDQIVIAVEKKTAAPNAPSFVPIADQTVLAGSPLHIPLEGFDPNSRSLTFTAVSSNPSIISTFINQTRRGLLMTVQDVGQLTYELFEDLVPNVTQHMISLIDSGILDNNILHRIINGFVFQGLDPTGTAFGHPGLLDFDDQFHPDLQHNSTGLLSMAKPGDDRNSSQVFSTDINLAANAQGVASLRRLDFNHSIFARQTSGENVRRLIMLTPTTGITGNPANRPLEDVVVQDVEILQIGDKASLMLKALPGVTGQTDVTITARDAQGNLFTQTIHVTVQQDTFNGSPFLSDYPASVLTTQNTPVAVQVEVTDVEGDPTIITALPIGLEATILFDNAGEEIGVTPPGTTTFSYLGTNWSGGTVTATGVSPLASSGSSAYLIGAGGGQVTFDVPIFGAEFFFVHANSQGPFTATAFDAGANVLGTVSSNAASTYNAAGNFEAISSGGVPITRIAFTGGHVDNFSFVAQAVAATFQINQVNRVVTVTPPSGFLGTLAVRLGVQQTTINIPDAHDPVDWQAIRVRVLPAGASAVIAPPDDDDADFRRPRPFQWDGARSRPSGQTQSWFAARHDNAILAWQLALIEEHDEGETVTRTEAYAAEEHELAVGDVDAVFEALELGVVS